MIIGIDGSRAFLEQRTGIEEYSYQVIKHLAYRQAGLTKEIKDCQVVLYIKHNQKIDFNLPDTWRAKKLWSPRLWTQIRLSLELLFHPVDVLFIPAHTVPIIHPARNASLFSLALFIQNIFKYLGIDTYYNQHSDAGGPKNTIVVIHGLEYEFVPAAYSWWAKFYMALIIKNSCRWAKKIIAVSKNTRQDLVNLYKVPEEKIEVIYEGYEKNIVIASEAKQSQNNINNELKNEIAAVATLPRNDKKDKYLLFIGRLEERKNIIGIIKAFEILKEKYRIPHKLILAGKEGYGHESSKFKVQSSKFKDYIILPGFVSEEEKWELLKNADVFLFPTFYEGFGLPILEAQSVGVPVVASNVSSIPEVTNGSALLADPTAAEFIAELTYDLISNEEVRSGIIKKGYENVKRFSWAKCAEEIRDVLTKIENG